MWYTYTVRFCSARARWSAVASEFHAPGIFLPPDRQMMTSQSGAEMSLTMQEFLEEKFLRFSPINDDGIEEKISQVFFLCSKWSHNAILTSPIHSSSCSICHPWINDLTLEASLTLMSLSLSLLQTTHCVHVTKKEEKPLFEQEREREREREPCWLSSFQEWWQLATLLCEKGREREREKSFLHFLLCH